MIAIPEEVFTENKKKDCYIARSERQISLVLTTPNYQKIRKIIEVHPNLVRNRLINLALSEYLDKLQIDE